MITDFTISLITNFISDFPMEYQLLIIVSLGILILAGRAMSKKAKQKDQRGGDVHIHYHYHNGEEQHRHEGE